MSARPSPGPGSRLRVLVAGGGVAGLELVLALRALAEDRVDVDILTPGPTFDFRPLSVLEPFGLGERHRVDLRDFAAELGAGLILDSLDAVDPADRTVATAAGETLRYDHLVVAIGARMQTGLEGAITFRGQPSEPEFADLLEEIDAGAVRRVAFVLPAGGVWPIPLYELALLTAARIAARGVQGAELTLITPEDDPLAIFGARARDAMGRLLAAAGISVLSATYAEALQDGGLEVVPGEPVVTDRVVTLPRLVGPRVYGLPHDHEGFIPVDRLGAVEGFPGVHAAGDATAFPVKQGGLATQQADAVASAIAAEAGAAVEPEPFRPVLRAQLIAGLTSRYLEADISGTAGDDSTVRLVAGYAPADKVAGRHLPRYLERVTGARSAEPPEDAERIPLELQPPAAGGSVPATEA